MKHTWLPRPTTRPCPTSRPGSAGRKNWTCRSSVGANCPSGSVAIRAGPSVSSSIAARKPPCTVPAGLTNSGRAWNETSIVPRSGSTATNSHPSAAAAGGAGALPAWMSQNNIPTLPTSVAIHPLNPHPPTFPAGVSRRLLSDTA
jgi:hypothetical protein